MTDQRHALVVDDNPTNRLLATTLLGKLGWTAVEVQSGEAALQRAATQAFRLILLDISMPGLSGEETCMRLRAIPSSPPLHILAYTAHAFQEDIDRLLAAGFDAVLVKPISRQRLEELTKNL
jgi:CheY-like chemotaxis protein